MSDYSSLFPEVYAAAYQLDGLCGADEIEGHSGDQLWMTGCGLIGAD